jgi:hypothetical protein
MLVGDRAMDALVERQQFTREQRERIMAEARATVHRLRNLKPRERPIDDGGVLTRWRREADAQRQAFPLIYKTRDATPATPAAATPAPDSDERMHNSFVLDVLAEVVAELSARHQAEIDSLSNKVDDLKRAFFKTPADLIESTRELRAALADVRTVLERAQSGPLDLPAVPSRRPN